jgi:hypothetical protein
LGCPTSSLDWFAEPSTFVFFWDYEYHHTRSQNTSRICDQAYSGCGNRMLSVSIFVTLITCFYKEVSLRVASDTCATTIGPTNTPPAGLHISNNVDTRKSCTTIKTYSLNLQSELGIFFSLVSCTFLGSKEPHLRLAKYSEDPSAISSRYIVRYRLAVSP